MQIRFFDDPGDYKEHAYPFLLQNEAANNLILGLVGGIERGRWPEFMLATVEMDGEIVGSTIRTPPHNLLMTEMPATAARSIAEEMSGRITGLRGVVGPASVCDAFQDEWTWRASATSRVTMRQGIYQLTEVVRPTRPAPGSMRPMREDEIDLVGAWIQGFADDTGITPPEPPRDTAKRRFEAGQLYVWEVDGAAVSLTGWAGPTPNGVRINAVYTPPESRGSGYASHLVADVSQLMLDQGRRFCFLYTDLDYPTSNRIYRALGYVRVADSVMVLFDY